MKNLSNKKSFLPIIFFLFSFLLTLSSCATSIDDNSKSSESSFRLSIPINAIASRAANNVIYTIECKLSGSVEFEDSKEASGSQQKVTFEFSDIPVGQTLIIGIKIYDQAGVLCFEGEETTVPKEKDNNVVVRLSKVGANPTYNVGDLILLDGSIIPYDANQTFTTEQINAAVAVIFKASTADTPALGVGLKQKETSWANAGSTGVTTKFNELCVTASGTTFTGYTDGSNSWQIICANDPNAQSNVAQYSAFELAENYTNYATNLSGTLYATGWYLPTISEFYDLTQNITNVYKVLEVMGGINPASKNSTLFFATPVQQVSSQWYWTSNQGSSTSNAYYAQCNGGSFNYSGSYGKDQKFYALVIRKFN